MVPPAPAPGQPRLTDSPRRWCGMDRRTELGQVGFIWELGVEREGRELACPPTAWPALSSQPVGGADLCSRQLIVSLESTKGPALPRLPTTQGPSSPSFLVWRRKAN